MKKMFFIIVVIFTIQSYGEKVFISKISSKMNVNHKTMIIQLLENDGFDVVFKKKDSDLVLSIFTDVKMNRNINWGGWLIAYPLFGIFHDVSNAYVTIKVANQSGEIIFKETVKSYSKEGYLFSDFKGGFKKIGIKAEKIGVKKAINKFLTDYML